MDIRQFSNKLVEKIEKQMGEEVSVRQEVITKNNGVSLNGIVIMAKEKNISPTIYIDDLFEAYCKGTSFAQILKKLLKIYENSSQTNNIDVEFFTNYQMMKKHLAYKLINFEKNKELLGHIPYIPFYDLAVVFYCIFQKDTCGLQGNCSILIHNHHLELWGVKKTMILKEAVKNTPTLLPPVISSLQQVIVELCKEDLKRGLEYNSQWENDATDEEQWLDAAAKKMAEPMFDGGSELQMYVLGNDKKLFGAAAMLYHEAMANFAQTIGRNFFILPCSIHELILMPDYGDKNYEQLKNMVSDVNETQLQPEEVLSSSIYYYDKEKAHISVLT